ncbi:DNA cytosine methyltransferase [Symbiobacterium terraclitae]|uniref:DNA cytosine methyltransferase n=1 Tax=Symbiobacterium terraclitae TaxID=557451 RepID=UPI0035B51576
MQQFVNIDMEYTTFYVFCGIGGAAIGAQQAVAEYRGLRGRAVVLGGVDNDPDACRDFEMLTGVPATCLDLFDREQYGDWHGHEPPADWREATPEDLRAAAQGINPDVVVVTAPCKGFSGLLSQEKSQSRRYQALNRLTFRGMFLALEAWKDNPPAFFLFENVPRIATRGRRFLSEIKRLLAAYGYVWDERHHDCGELGGLAQRRRRYLLVARNPAKVSSYLYHPPRQRVRAIGEVLSELPMPDDPAAGPLHRLPRLTWKTWVRLALIPPGGDWRDLQRIQPGQYTITYSPRDGALRVGCWDAPAGPVVGSAAVTSSNGIAAVADPRYTREPRAGVLSVQDWTRASSTVTGGKDPNGNMLSVADPRLPETPRFNNVQRVTGWGEPAGAVTGAAGTSNAAPVVADPRGEYYVNMLRVTPWSEASNTITGATGPNKGAALVADPRLGCNPRNGTYGVQAWDQPANTVTASGDVHAGAAAVADPRIPDDAERGVWVIVSPWGYWHRPLTTLDLLALQGFPTRRADGGPVVLAGRSDRAWRERIGNAVPPPTMAAIMGQMLFSLLASETGDFRLDALQTGVWVRPERAAVAQ